MLDLPISLVAGFAAFTAYVIAGDEIRANPTKQQPALKQPVLPKSPSKPVARLTKELNADHATIPLAAEKQINDKKVTSIKRGGHPALALNN